MIVAIDDGEHLLVKKIEEFVHHVREVEFSPEKITFELHKKVAKHVRILFVDDTVGLLKHLMEAVTGLCKKLLEKF